MTAVRVANAAVLRPATLALLVFAMLGAVPTPASAQGGIRHWLEKLSGPGPFTTGVVYVSPVCYGSKQGSSKKTTITPAIVPMGPGQPPKDRLVPRARRRWKARTAKNPSRVRAEARGASGNEAAAPPPRKFYPGWECSASYSDLPNVYFYYELGWDNGARSNLQYEAEDGATPDPSVGLQSHIVGLTFSKSPWVEVGAGVGGFRFNPNFGDRDPFWKAALQPVRVNVRPLALFRRLEELNAAQALMLSVQSFVVLGTLTDEDFGAIPGTYRESNEVVWTTAVTLDVFRLFSKKQKPD